MEENKLTPNMEKFFERLFEIQKELSEVVKNVEEISDKLNALVKFD